MQRILYITADPYASLCCKRIMIKKHVHFVFYEVQENRLILHLKWYLFMIIDLNGTKRTIDLLNAFCQGSMLILDYHS